MPYKLTVNQPNLGDGGAILIQGLGTFKNGTYQVSDEQADAYRVARAHTVTHPDNPYQVTGTELGPTLEEAAKSMYGVTVVNVGPETPERESEANVQQSDKGPVDPASQDAEGGK